MTSSDLTQGTIIVLSDRELRIGIETDQGFFVTVNGLEKYYTREELEEMIELYK